MADKEKTAVEEGQQHLPGMKPRVNKKIDAAAKDYAKARDARMEMSKTEKEAKDKLLTVMEKLNVAEYSAGGVSVTVNIEKSPKVKVVDPEAEAAQDRNEETNGEQEKSEE